MFFRSHFVVWSVLFHCFLLISFLGFSVILSAPPRCIEAFTWFHCRPVKHAFRTALPPPARPFVLPIMPWGLLTSLTPSILCHFLYVLRTRCMHIFLWHLLFLILQLLFPTMFSKQYRHTSSYNSSSRYPMSSISSTLFFDCPKDYSVTNTAWTCRLSSVIGNYKPYNNK